MNGYHNNQLKISYRITIKNKYNFLNVNLNRIIQSEKKKIYYVTRNSKIKIKNINDSCLNQFDSEFSEKRGTKQKP